MFTCGHKVSKDAIYYMFAQESIIHCMIMDHLYLNIWAKVCNLFAGSRLDGMQMSSR